MRPDDPHERELRQLVAGELAESVDPRVTAFAESVARRHGAASRAVLFYGSCLRDRQLEAMMLDFYLIVSDYRSAFPQRWLAAANRIVPPNVFHVHEHGLVAKYAVLSERDFHRLNGPETRNVSVWARFAQPSRLVWAADERAREDAVTAVARAAPTLLAAAGIQPGEPPLDLWRRAFALTYSAEIRPERKERAESVVEIDPERYLRFTPAAVALAGTRAFKRSISWSRRRLIGRSLHVLRLAKGSVTFAGAPDYIIWKINRHAGTDFALKPWQRRFPLIAAISLLPRLLKSGAVR